MRLSNLVRFRIRRSQPVVMAYSALLRRQSSSPGDGPAIGETAVGVNIAESSTTVEGGGVTTGAPLVVDSIVYR